MKEDYEKCKKYAGKNICSISHPYISYCDVNRNNLQCPENCKPDRIINESDRFNQIPIEIRLIVGIEMIKKIKELIECYSGFWENEQDFIIDSIRHNLSNYNSIVKEFRNNKLIDEESKK